MRTIILIFSLFFLGVNSSIRAQVEKISPDLQDEMALRRDNELIPIVINLSFQPDLENLKTATRAMTRFQKRDYIINQLKTIATITQVNILSYLRREHEEKAQMIKSIYLANVIAVRLQNQLISNVANMSEVNYVFMDHVSFDLSDTTWNVKKIRADDVWQNFGYTGDGVIVGVMDTGIDYDHEDLDGNIWVNPAEDFNGNGRPDFYPYYGGGDLDYQDNDNNGKVDDLVGWDWNNGSSEDNNPMDDYGHGTHVAGIIAGDGTNGTKTGVAPGAKIMPLKIWQSGSGPSSNYWKAVEYALENGADIVNLSGGKRYYQISEAEKATFRQVFESAITAGMAIVVAAGNEGHLTGGYDPPNNIRTPGNVPMVITVGATDINDNIAYFSSRGPVEWWNLCKPADEWGLAICYNDYPYPPGLLKPDASAPGVNVTSTKWGGGYTIMSGTSMATPATSGVVALMLEAAPNMAPEMAKDILEGTALELGPAGKDSIYGSGRIDAYDALKYTIEHYGGTFAQDLVIPSGETWTISPGVTLKFASGKRLIVYGTLIAEGNASDRITFTRSGSSGSWYGIKFENSSVDASCIIKYADIEHATYGIYCYQASPKIEYNTISNCAYGLRAYYGNPTVVHNTISNNSTYGVYLYRSSPKLRYNVIKGHSGASDAGVYAASGRINIS